MAQPSPERKGRRRSIQILVVFILAAIVSVPVAFVVGALITPALWKLEPMVGMELAGHSGPSDWILITLAAALTAVVTALYVWTTRPKRELTSGETPAA